MKTLHKLWTYEDYYRLTDDKRYEVIDGELIEMAPAPYYQHQRILVKLLTLLNSYIEKKNMGHVTCAPVDVRLDDTNCVQPDIFYIANENKKIIKKKGVFGSPDLVIEILSHSKKRDRKIKYKLYEKFGVKEYWIIDPDKREIEVFVLEGDRYKLFMKGDKVKSKLLGDFELEFSELED